MLMVNLDNPSIPVLIVSEAQKIVSKRCIASAHAVSCLILVSCYRLVLDDYVPLLWARVFKLIMLISCERRNLIFDHEGMDSTFK